ncbi:uncharacterized protein TNCV_318321 [Trichonephila clavipes]|nr:uncharacterized protein TNCV_318321 [Trichonephila clavipes]
MVLIPQHWNFRGEYSQDKSGIGKLAWKLSDFIKRDGTVNIRRSSRENRSTRKRVRLKLRPQNNIYRNGKVRVETRHLDFKIVDPTWMKQGVARKLRESEIEFQKRCFKRRAKPKVTIREDKASPRLYWDRGKRSSRDIIIITNVVVVVLVSMNKCSRYYTIHGKRCHSLQEVGLLPVGPRKETNGGASATWGRALFRALELIKECY